VLQPALGRPPPGRAGQAGRQTRRHGIAPSSQRKGCSFPWAS
jgi:hypothetical protein